MKTLVFADLHLGTDNTEDQVEITGWMNETITEVKPHSIVFAGDTFELILPIEHTPKAALENKEAVLGNIFNSWEMLFYHLRRSPASEFIFIPGEHDHDITEERLETRIKQGLIPKRARTASHHYDSDSSALIMHGHELDYNRIFDVNGRRISCVDGLTRAITRFLTQTPEVEARIRRATRRQDFSYWYSFGGLPKYVEAVGKLFGADQNIYEREVAEVLRSKDVNKWIDQQKSLLTHAIGGAAKMVALDPQLLMELYTPFYKILGRIVDHRIKSVVEQKPYADAPNYCFGRPVQNLVLGHFHQSQERHFANGSFYNVSSPRIHVDGIEGRDVQLHQDYSYVVIDGNNTQYFTETKRKKIPCSTYNKDILSK